jgi:GT2 family glycosyltransferase
MSPTPVRVAAVLLARDRPEVTARTLEAVVAQGPDALILVSNDGTPAVDAVLRDAAAAHPDARVVRLDRNLGAAGGFHAGFAAALERDDLDAVWCFDDDATPAPDCLTALKAAYQRLDRVGCAGALTHDGSGRLSWPLWPVDTLVPLHTLDEARRAAGADGALAVAGLSWHALLVPLAVLRAHGNVWAELFHQYEDAEFGLRIRDAGLCAYAVAEAECLHPPAPPAREARIARWSIRVTEEAPAKEYLTIRNDLVVRRRYNGARFWYGTMPLIVLRGLLVCLRRRDMSRWRAVRDVWLRAIGDAARGRLGPPPAGL